MRRLRVLVLMHPDLIPPDSLKGHSEQDINVWKTEYDVVSTLRANGHEVRPLGVKSELAPIRDEVESWKPTPGRRTTSALTRNQTMKASIRLMVVMMSVRQARALPSASQNA